MAGLGLTQRQAELLAFIERFQAERGWCPSTNEMRAELGLASKGGIVRLLDSLEERGRIRRIPNRARSVEVVRQIGRCEPVSRAPDGALLWSVPKTSSWPIRYAKRAA